jgi:hypothetical protein
LPPETLACFDATHIGSVEQGTLRRALAASVRALLDEARQARLPTAEVVAMRLLDFQDARLGVEDNTSG